MNEYIRGRLRADAQRAVQLAIEQTSIQHAGLRGRFRELIVDNLVSPWLPPYAVCGSGTIIDADNRERKSTQDDIVIFDQSLMPSVLISSNSTEGVFPINAVLARIEVKSKLTRNELRNAIDAAAEIQLMKFVASEGPTWSLPVSLIFAFDTDIISSNDQDAELKRMISVCAESDLWKSQLSKSIPCPVSGLCVVNRGFWAFGSSDDNDAKWLRARRDPASPLEEVILFIGSLSNTCFQLHTTRQGRDPKIGVEGGIGRFVVSYSTYEPISISDF